MKTNWQRIYFAMGFGLLAVTSTIGITGCAGDRYERSTGEYIDDKSLVMRVKSALGDNAEYKFGDVSVASFRGVVELNGFVNTSDQKRKAEDLAKQVQGVKSIKNNLSIKQ